MELNLVAYKVSKFGAPRVSYKQGVTKRCRLSLLTNSALVNEPKFGGGGGGGVAGSQPNSTVVHRSLNKLWRSNSIFNLCLQAFLPHKLESFIHVF
jgi:hypothetical protein